MSKKQENKERNNNRKIQPIVSIKHWKLNKLQSEYIKNLIEQQKLSQVGSVSKKPLFSFSDAQYSDQQIRSAISAVQTEEILENINRKLDAKEQKIIEERFQHSMSFFNDAFHTYSPHATMTLRTLACEILYETIARMVVKSIKSEGNLHKAFQRKHGIKLRWGIDNKLFGMNILVKEADYRLEDLKADENAFFEALKHQEDYDDGFLRHWIFTNGRYIRTRKFVEYLENIYNKDLIISYAHLHEIYRQLRSNDPKTVFFGGSETEKLVVTPVRKIKLKRSFSLKDKIKMAFRL